MENKIDKLKFADAKNIVAKNLKTLFNVEEFEITHSKQEEYVWKINAEFKEKINNTEKHRTALFSIDTITGEVKEFRKDYMGRF